ncbi:MAG: pyridoxine 5'-phosphate synthase [Thermoanaerobaculia bacterium]
MTRLSVNVDHIATLRQARGVAYPDPVEAAVIAEAAGAHGITVHLRCDRRHIQDRDVFELRKSVAGKLNLEMSVEAQMIAIALEARPDQVTLVPERPEEVTTEGGLDLARKEPEVARAANALAEAGISVSLFLDPEPEQVHGAARLLDIVDGFEINTDLYTKRSMEDSDGELARICECARLGAQAGLAVYAGHGLTTDNVGAVSAIAEIEELNIGHALISHAALVGLERAVGEMLAAMLERA